MAAIEPRIERVVNVFPELDAARHYFEVCEFASRQNFGLDKEHPAALQLNRYEILTTNNPVLLPVGSPTQLDSGARSGQIIALILQSVD